MSLLFILFYYVNWKPNDQRALIGWVYPVHTLDHGPKQAVEIRPSAKRGTGNGSSLSYIQLVANTNIPCSGISMDPGHPPDKI